MDGDPPPRRPAAGRLPHAVPRRRARPGRPARIPARTTTCATSTGTSPRGCRQPHVRQFTEDRELNAWFLLDLSGSVDFGSQRAHQAGGVGELRRRAGARCSRATATASARCCTAPGRRACCRRAAGRSHVLELLQRMRMRPAPPKPTRAAARHRLAQTLLQTRAAGMMRRAARWSSSSPTSSARPAGKTRWRAWRGATRCWRCGCTTRSRWSCPTSAWSRSRTPRPASRSSSTPTTRRSASASLQLAAQHEAELRAALGQAGVDTLELATDDDLVDALLRFADAAPPARAPRGRRRACRRTCAAAAHMPQMRERRHEVPLA